MQCEAHRQLQPHTEPTVHAQTHAQPESISVNNARGLDELTSVVTSIDIAHTHTHTHKHTHFFITFSLLACVRVSDRAVFGLLGCIKL